MNATLIRPFPNLANLSRFAGPLSSSVVSVFKAPTQESSANSMTAFAVTPLTGDFLINCQGDTLGGPSPDDAADAALVYSFAQHDGLGTLKTLLTYARRKPGTTGAIAAQTITVRKNDGAGTVLATFTVAAAAAGAEPESGVVYTEYPGAGSITGITAFHITCSAGQDADLMVVVVALGEN